MFISSVSLYQNNRHGKYLPKANIQKTIMAANKDCNVKDSLAKVALSALPLSFYGLNKINTEKVKEDEYNDIAELEKYEKFNNWLNNRCHNLEISDHITNKIIFCGEELYTNVVKYAYGAKKGELAVSLKKQNDEVILQVSDKGIPYNPLSRKDPDISLGLEERPIGGLGIYLIKKMATNVSYEYKDNKNILTLKFIDSIK